MLEAQNYCHDLGSEWSLYEGWSYLSGQDKLAVEKGVIRGGAAVICIRDLSQGPKDYLDAIQYLRPTDGVYPGESDFPYKEYEYTNLRWGAVQARP